MHPIILVIIGSILVLLSIIITYIYIRIVLKKDNQTDNNFFINKDQKKFYRGLILKTMIVLFFLVGIVLLFSPLYI